MYFEPGRIIVIFKNLSIAEIMNFCQERNLEFISCLPPSENLTTCLVGIPIGKEIEFVKEIKDHPNVSSIGPNRYIK